MSDTTMPARRRFCAKPFQHLEIAPDGNAYVCCRGWLPESIGNVWREPVSSLLNGWRAQELRKSILNDSFAHCTGCPFLTSVTGPVRHADEVVDPREREILDSGKTTVDGVVWLNLAYDQTCNLSCPSCRSDLIVARGQRYRELEVLQQLVLDEDLLARCEWLYVTGSGDPFASRLCRELLRSIDPTRYPRLKVKLHTNALLFTPEAWRDLGPVRASVREVEVSVDAATAETYAINRRGGDWETLLRRLGFIASLRRAGAMECLQMSFVVQANNWREMPAFVDLAETFGADRVLFTPLRNWSTFSREELAARAVHDPGHPAHAAFMESLADERFRRAHVQVGDLPPLAFAR